MLMMNNKLYNYTVNVRPLIFFLFRFFDIVWLIAARIRRDNFSSKIKPHHFGINHRQLTYAHANFSKSKMSNVYCTSVTRFDGNVERFHFLPPFPRLSVPFLLLGGWKQYKSNPSCVFYF